MQCYLCGKDIGDDLGACENCRKEADDRRTTEYEALTEEPNAEAWDGELKATEAFEIIAKNKKIFSIVVAVIIAIGLAGFGATFFLKDALNPVRGIAKEAIATAPDYVQNQGTYDRFFEAAYERASSEGVFAKGSSGEAVNQSAELIVRYMIEAADEEGFDGIASELRLIEVPSG